MEEKESPYFIGMRGCINCDASKSLKKKFGQEYGFDHEIMAKCLITGCFQYGHVLTNPFIDVEEVVKLVNKRKENLTEENLKNVRKYLTGIKQRFGKHYDEIGVSIDDLIKEI